MYASVEEMKRMNLVEFLTHGYGLEFRRRGSEYACCSPFTEERAPSFFVRLVNGHWLFKDFSSGAAGTIFDFVRMKEGLRTFSEAVRFVRERVGGWVNQIAHHNHDSAATPQPARGYDVEELYGQFRRQDPQVCREYLLRRGIDAQIVEELIGDGTVVHNRYEGRSYCCFAVRDEGGQLRCLDNHAVEGRGKFVLGAKSVFTREWGAIKQARVVLLCEGIIDYLSVKSLELSPPPGLALLGNQLCFERALLERTEVLIAAMDDDRGGNSAVLDLKDLYPDKEVHIYDLEGHKDPNELLMAARSGKGRKLSPQRKLQLYREFQQTENKAELARRWGIDRSYMYQVVGDCEAALLQAFMERRPGRPPIGTPKTLDQALARIKELERQYEREATAREELLCRSEFLAIRLKYAEIEAAELRGEKVDEEHGVGKKPQIKKTKNGKP
ncbi:MAG: CHC2 zinc finger domain-containing protein [Acidobacteriota bacterium]